MPSPTGRTWAEIDLSALLNNFRLAQATQRPVMCVVKADAYGHGAAEIARYLEAHGADRFAVACLPEAIELREAGVTRPILVLGYTPPVDAPEAAARHVALAVVDEQTARAYDAACANAGTAVTVHVAVDTGMSRIGVLARGAETEAAGAVARIAGMQHLVAEGLFTHLSVADTPDEDAYTASQLDCFERVIALLAERGIRLLCHAANSACILRHPRARFDLVREGIMLYGLYPDSAPQQGPLCQVMTLKTRVAQIKTYPAGASVSYGRTFRTDAPLQTAVLPAGYADGYPRRLSNQGTVVIRGRAFRQIGRVCMDMCMVDVTGSDAAQGDEAVLFGNGGMSLETVSQIVGTINYELSCLVTRRVPRVYVNREENGA